MAMPTRLWLEWGDSVIEPPITDMVNFYKDNDGSFFPFCSGLIGVAGVPEPYWPLTLKIIIWNFVI